MLRPRRKQSQVLGYGDQVIRPNQASRLRYWSRNWRTGLLKSVERSLFSGEINSTAPFEWWHDLLPVKSHLRDCQVFVPSEILTLEVKVQKIDESDLGVLDADPSVAVIDAFRPKRMSYALSDVLVDTWSGACWTPTGWVLGESTGMPYGGGIPDEVRESWRRGTTRVFEEPVVVLPSHRNFFHWLIDLMPAFLASQMACQSPPLVVGNAKSPSWVRRHCQSLGIKVNWIEDRVVSCREYFVTGRGRSEGRRAEVELLRAAASELLESACDMDYGGGIFLSRSGHSRTGAVDENVEKICGEVGARVVDCGALDLADQIRLFSMARWIVAPTGAALANLVWAQPETPVLVIADERFSGSPWGHFGPLADSLGLRLNGVQYAGSPTIGVARYVREWLGVINQESS